MAIQQLQQIPYQRRPIPILPQANTVGPSHIYSEAIRQLGEAGDSFMTKKLKQMDVDSAKEVANIGLKGTMHTADKRLEGTKYSSDKQYDWETYRADRQFGKSNEKIDEILDRPISDADADYMDFNLDAYPASDRPTLRKAMELQGFRNLRSKEDVANANVGQAWALARSENARAGSLENALEISNQTLDLQIQQATGQLKNDLIGIKNTGTSLNVMSELLNDPRYQKAIKDGAFADLDMKKSNAALKELEVSMAEKKDQIMTDTQLSTTDRINALNDLSRTSAEALQKVRSDIEYKIYKHKERAVNRLKNAGYASVQGTRKAVLDWLWNEESRRYDNELPEMPPNFRNDVMNAMTEAFNKLRGNGAVHFGEEFFNDTSKQIIESIQKLYPALENEAYGDGASEKLKELIQYQIRNNNLSPEHIRGRIQQELGGYKWEGAWSWLKDAGEATGRWIAGGPEDVNPENLLKQHPYADEGKRTELLLQGLGHYGGGGWRGN